MRGQKARDEVEIRKKEKLKPVYKIDLVVRENPLTGAAEIVPLRSNKSAQRKATEKRVHIICGGGSGSYISSKPSTTKGYEVSCGVLNVGDSVIMNSADPWVSRPSQKNPTARSVAKHSMRTCWQ